jgi:hypothetical protein
LVLLGTGRALGRAAKFIKSAHGKPFRTMCGWAADIGQRAVPLDAPSCTLSAR